MVPSLARELQPLRVNAVSPGLIATPWWNFLPTKPVRGSLPKMLPRLQLSAFGQPEDVAEVIAMFISNTFLTGTIIDCDGGAHLK